MALQLNDATAIINRTTGLVAASSDYACCFWYQTDFTLGATSDYIAPLALINAGYTAWTGIFTDNTTNPQTYEINVSDGGAAVSTANEPLDEDKGWHLGYRRSGNTHLFYVDGALIGSVVKDISGVTLAELLLGNDGFGVVDAPLRFREFREWNDDLTATILAAERMSQTAVHTANLVTDCPLVDDLSDISGNGNHFSGAGDFEFIADEDPPANITAGSATALTAQSGSITQTVDDGWRSWFTYFKYTNSTPLDQAFSFGAWGDLGGGGFRPFTNLFVGSVFIGQGFENGSLTIPIPAGVTLTIQVRAVNGGNVAPATLHLNWYVGPAGAYASGHVFIRSATFSGVFNAEDVPITGLVAGFIDTEASAIVGFIPQFICGESGDVLPTSGRMGFFDEGGSLDGFPDTDPENFSYWHYLFENDFTIINRVAFASPLLPPLNRTHEPSEKFYLLGRFLGAVHTYATVDANGTLSDVKTITSAGRVHTALAVNNAETIMYLGGPTTNSALKRWDMVGEAYLSDLAAAVASYAITDILVLPDDSIVVCYWKSTSAEDAFVRRYDPSGAILNTYTFTFTHPLGSLSSSTRLGYASDAVPAFWVFHHTQDAFNDIRRIRVSDGVELVQSLTPNGVNSIFEQADPPIPYSSDSCPILELRASAAEGGNPAFQGVIGPLVWWHMRRRVIQ